MVGGRGEVVVGRTNVVVFILKQDWSYLLIVDVLYVFFADCGSYFFSLPNYCSKSFIDYFFLMNQARP